jgi:hypothetical protein
MFTENLRFLGQILHPQWPAQTFKNGPKNGPSPLGVKIKQGVKGSMRYLGHGGLCPNNSFI